MYAGIALPVTVCVLRLPGAATSTVPHPPPYACVQVVAQILRKLVDDVQVKVHNKVMPPVADWQPSPPPKPPSSDSDSDYDKPSSKKKSSSKKGQKGKKGKKGSWSSFFGGSRASYD